MAVNKKLLNIVGAVLAAVIIAVCSVIIFNATNDRRAVNPQSFSGKAIIVSLESDGSQLWAKACKVTVRDEKKRELAVNTRSDVCGNSKPGDVLVMDAGQVVLGQSPQS